MPPLTPPLTPVVSEPRAQARGHAPTTDVTRLAPGAQIEFDIPTVVATRRLDNGPPETVEIVMDRPIPYNATTRFTFNDGVAVQMIEYTYAPGDTDGDGDADLYDFAAYQNCFGVSPVAGSCLPFDFNADSAVDLLDFVAFQRVLTAP